MIGLRSVILVEVAGVGVGASDFAWSQLAFFPLAPVLLLDISNFAESHLHVCRFVVSVSEKDFGPVFESRALFEGDVEGP